MYEALAALIQSIVRELNSRESYHASMQLGGMQGSREKDLKIRLQAQWVHNMFH